MNKLTNFLLILCLIGIGYVIYYQHVVFPNELKTCGEAASVFERLRHPTGDLEVTNQDIASYMKNVLACVAD